MQCRVCGQDNPSEASFCGKCGAVLTVTAEPISPLTVPAPPQTVVPVVQTEYMGFWIRFVAAIIDAVILGVIFTILSVPAFIGSMFFPFRFFWFPLPWLYYWLFTGLKGQTPGKMVVGIKVVNAQGEKPELGTAAVREIIGRFISGAAFCLGYLWIVIDEEKRGWHDSIASTHVVRVDSTK